MKRKQGGASTRRSEAKRRGSLRAILGRRQRLDDSIHTIAIPVQGDRDSASPHGRDRSHRTAQSRATWLGWRRMGEGEAGDRVVLGLYGRQWAAERRAAHPPAQGQRKSHCQSQKQPLRALRPAEAGLGWSQNGGWRGPSLSAVVAAEVLLLARAAASRYLRSAAPVMLAGTAAANRHWVTLQAVALHVPCTFPTLISQLS